MTVEEKLYTKEDYADYCEHEEPLIRNWGFEHLTKLYPKAEVTIKYLLKFIKETEDRDLKYIIRDYLQKNYHYLSGERLYTCLEEAENIALDMKSLVLNILARKGYKPKRIVEDIGAILESNEYRVDDAFKLQGALGELQTEQAYQVLKSINPELKLESVFIEIYFGQVIKYRKRSDIKQILRRVLRNLDQKVRKGEIFNQLSELFYGREFFEYLSSRFGFTDNFEEVVDCLERYWPENQGVAKFIETLDESISTADIDQQGEEVINYLQQNIRKKLTAKYEFEAELNPDFFAANQAEMTEADGWIGFMAGIIEQEKDYIFQQNEEEFFIYFLTAALIVLEEEIDFEQAVSKAREDEEYLWEVFTLDREVVPAEITELVIEQGDKWEEKVISLLAENKYSSRVERALEVLGAINSKQAVPQIIELLDDRQSDVICEQAQKTLEKIEELPIDLVVNAVSKGDFTRAIYLTSILEWYPSEYIANVFIRLWELEDKIPTENFVYVLRNIGSEVGLDYLEENCPVEREYLYETVFILAVVNDKKKKIKDYKKKLKRFKEKGIDDFNLGAKTENSSGNEYERNENGALVRKQEKVGRNDPCPCGSGKKYKKCCGKRS